MVDKVREALVELVALVKGECPSLLDEDCGGNVRLALEIDYILAAPPQEQAPTIEDLKAGLKFYADKAHFDIADESAWDTVSGEPQNFWCDEAGTATVEDGSVARAVLAGQLTAAQLANLDELSWKDDAAPSQEQAKGRV